MFTNKEFSQAEILRANHKSNYKSILFLTGITDSEYCGFIAETATSWVTHFFVNKIDTNALLDCSFFWKWFRWYWNYVDEKYVVELYKYEAERRLMVYRQMHQEIFDTHNQATKYLIEDFVAMQDEWTNAIIEHKARMA